ncbi:Cell division protein FtsI [Peptidoglycan synthetase] [hydrothermal vent metagenome]|uniref:Cell division protein FtsI [Peptidoglycan synthetase] n=1 Tax=hydrothermal vent metagenome TaxID=652676 RepID=A0A1W1EJQ8_9ZZZZ
MNKYKKNQQTNVRSSKLLLLYSLIVIAVSIFLYRVYYIVKTPRDLPSSTAKKLERAKRGSIISADRYIVSYSKNIYQATINTKSIYPNKLELFIELFSIYSQMDRDIVKSALLDKYGDLIFGRVVISNDIDEKDAIRLKSLAYKLKRLKVFRPIKNANGVEVVYGLDITEVKESRFYPFDYTLSPITGYIKSKIIDGYKRPVGMKGLERYYNKYLESKRDGYFIGKRDVSGNIVYGDNSKHVKPIDGLDLHLNIPLTLQTRVEKILTYMKKKVDASEIIVGVMESKTGKILSLASSERFNPNLITQDKISALNPKFTEYLYEPGSVIKPLSLAIVMDAGKVKANSWIKTYNGKLRIGKKYIINDDEKFHSLSARGIIVHSSNVGISQIVWRISGRELYDGFRRFGLGVPSGIDLSRELKGFIKTPYKLNHKVHSANSSYGYGMHTNFMQLLKAYSAFNNDGVAVTPQIIDYFKDNRSNKYYKLKPSQPNLKAMSIETTNSMKSILKSVVRKGTGVEAQYKGLIIGGKTGTAHISLRGKYGDSYNSSFFGFANDSRGKKYTIGVLVIKAKKKYKYFASQSAVPTFKHIVEEMVKLNYLKPSL